MKHVLKKERIWSKCAVSHTHTQDTRKCFFKSPVDAMQECDLPGYVTPLVST
jgi:hypothetical protein